MEQRSLDLTLLWLRRLAASLAVLFVMLFLYTALKRLHYPFELEKMESGMATSVWRVSHGLPVYSAPTMEWVPFLYAPVFFYVCAAVSKFTGAGYVATRLVSILSTLGICGGIFTFVYAERRRVAPALAAAGLYACLYSVLGAWFDLGRVDSLTLFFAFIALLLTRFSNPVLAAVAWLLVAHTKQGFLPVAPVLFLFEWRRPARAVLGIVAYIALAAGSIMWLQHATNGWYSFYAFGTPGQLKWVWRQAVLFFPNDLAQVTGIALLLIAAAAILQRRRAATLLQDRRVSFYFFASVVMIGATWYVRAHSGASANSLFPAYAWIAVLFGLAIASLETESLRIPDLRLRPAMLCVLWTAVVLQLGMHLYNPGRWVPNADSLRARQSLLELMRRAPGDVWAISHSWDNVLAGKPTHPELDSFDAVVFRPVNDRTRGFVDQLHAAYRDGQFSAVLFDNAPETYLLKAGFQSPDFQKHYGLRVIAPGVDEPHLVDQPRFIQTSCSAAALPGDPFLTHTALISAAHCAQ